MESTLWVALNNLFIITFFSFVIFSLRIKVIGLVLNATNLHYCLSRDRMKFGILGPKDRFVQDMCQQETFHHRGQGDTIKKGPELENPNVWRELRCEVSGPRSSTIQICSLRGRRRSVFWLVAIERAL